MLERHVHLPRLDITRCRFWGLLAPTPGWEWTVGSINMRWLSFSVVHHGISVPHSPASSHPPRTDLALSCHFTGHVLILDQCRVAIPKLLNESALRQFGSHILLVVDDRSLITHILMD